MAGKKKCEVDGCETPAFTANRCKRHGPRCNVEGCNNATGRFGKCATHGPKCSEPGCYNIIAVGITCRAHGRTCIVGGCNNTEEAKNRCTKHGPKCILILKDLSGKMDSAIIMERSALFQIIIRRLLKMAVMPANK